MSSKTHHVCFLYLPDGFHWIDALPPAELEELPDVLNDLDVDFSANPAAAAAYLNDKRNHRKIREATNKLKVNVMNPLREGKKLLVLDIDYSKRLTLSSTLLLMPNHSYSRHKAIDIRCSATD